MTKSLAKDFRREIRKSISRFISIMLIVALGVAFYSGVRSTMPAMHKTADATYDKQNLMDIRVVGTMGLTQSDLGALSRVEGIQDIEGSFTTDFLCIVQSKEIVTRAISMTEKINGIKLEEGNHPTKYNECLVSKEFLEESGLKIGETLKLSTGTDTPVSDTLATDTYLIVGVCSSSYFLNGDVGTSTVGDGMADGYIVIPRQAFVTDVFTSIYITVKGAEDLNCYSNKYQKLIDTVAKKIEEISSKRCEIRYAEINANSTSMLLDARADYEEAQRMVEEELTKAVDELAAKEKLIEDSKKELESNKEILENAEENLPIFQKEVAEGERKIANGETQLELAKGALSELKSALDDANDDFAEMQQDPEADPNQLQGIRDTIDTLQMAYDEATSAVAEAEIELELGKEELLKAKVAIGELQNAIANKGTLVQAEQDVMDADALLREAREEYEVYKADALAELEDAEEELAEAEREVNEMEPPIWHVLDRQSIEAYMSYVTDSDSIGAIGTVFPMIFFLVAALVSLTTMTRMVEEQRMQIGTMKALGYGKLSIASKYLLYSASASVIGSLIGVFAGELTIPPIIITAYRVVYYNLGENILSLNILHALTASILATLCTTLSAFFACYYSLRSVPAELMRPVAPKAGKHTFMEKIKFVWQRLNFGQKSAIRNLFRYKKRFFMTLFGVSGCMALLIVGLGIRDSISSMVDIQYGDIFSYTGVVSVDSSITRSERRKMLSKVEMIPSIDGYVQAKRTMISAASSANPERNEEKNAYLVVPTDVEQFAGFVKLQESGWRERDLMLSDKGVIITEKYAELLDVGVNDSIFIKIDEFTVTPKEVKVVGITENYIFNYVYMTPTLYHSIYNIEPDINILMIKSNGLFSDQNLKLALTRIGGVNSVITNTEEVEGMNEVINNLYFIIILMVVSAAILAFVVLYNLNNINITERRRELATFRLLGFYHNELASYIYRENIILTVFGIILGVLLGVVLHRFVMVTVETDVYMFGRDLNPLSILIATILTIIFTVIVNLIMRHSLKKIDMIESLKSVE